MLSEKAKRAIAWTSGVVPLLSAIAALTFWVDSRYAHAEDFQRSLTQQNLVNQETFIELRLEQNTMQTRNLARRLSTTSTPKLDQEEMQDLRASREALRKRQNDVRMQLHRLR